jgi:hypothetical protein
VADPTFTRGRLAVEQFLEGPDASRPLPHQELATLDDGQTSAVITAIFEPAESRDQDRRSLMTSDVTHNPAHAYCPCLILGTNADIVVL